MRLALMLKYYLDRIVRTLRDGKDIIWSIDSMKVKFCRRVLKVRTGNSQVPNLQQINNFAHRLVPASVHAVTKWEMTFLNKLAFTEL